MANTKSAQKRVRQTETRTERNKTLKTRVRSMRKKVLAAIEAGDKDAASSAAREFSSSVDKALKSNVFHKRTASRLKSNMAKKASAVQ